LGGRLSPSFVRSTVANPNDTWFDRIVGGNHRADADTRASLKTRASLHGAKVTIRIGADAPSIGRTRTLLVNLLGSLRIAQAAGVRINIVREPASKLIHATRPWRWPLRLSSRELVSLTGWPLSKDDNAPLPGQPGKHPKTLAPPDKLAISRRPFAETTAPGTDIQVGISATDSLQHTVLLGATGAGKSSTMLTLIMDAVHSGRGVLVIDPKTDLVNDVLARIPANRADDVVVLDPTDPNPVGLNPLRGDRRDASLTADAILAVFKELSGDSWGVRTQDMLSGALLTLAQIPDATLPMLPSLLIDDGFRRKHLRHINDHLGLESFWATYDAMSPKQRAEVIAPTMIRLRQFLLRPQLRAVLGQASPKFELADLFTKRRIVLVSLNRGQLGTEAARLFGSLIVGQLWPLILRRAGLPPERRHAVNVFIDEVQDYLALPTDLEDALAQSRGLGVGFTVAHQYRHQLPAALRSGIDTNARNKIIFGLGADDAGEMAKQAPELTADDFIYLPRFGIYTSLMHGGHSTGWFSARTLLPEPAIREPAELRARSASLYGRNAKQVEVDVLASIGVEPTVSKPVESDEGIGRRPHSGSQR